MTCFTHVDPFEDTERLDALVWAGTQLLVSPTSIRSRILKGVLLQNPPALPPRFTHVDPFEDTESVVLVQNNTDYD